MDWKNYINDDLNGELKKNAEILDQIDLSKYCRAGLTLGDIMSQIEGDFNGSELASSDVCKGCILNWFDEEDLAGYLKDRYPDLNIVRREKVWYELTGTDRKR